MFGFSITSDPVSLSCYQLPYESLLLWLYKACHILAFVIDVLGCVIVLLALWSAICLAYERFTVSPGDTV